MSKNDGGKYISIWQRTRAASFSNSSNLPGSMTLLHITLKTKHRQVMTTRTLLGRISRIATGNSCCINKWQSWDFKPTNFISLMDTMLLIFEEYHCGTLKLRRQWQKLLFSFVDIGWHAGGRYVREPCDIGWNCSCIPISTKSWRHFKSSFVLPLMLRRVQIKLSQTFFSMCITFIQRLTSRSDQYRWSKNMDLFFHMFVLVAVFFFVSIYVWNDLCCIV